MEPKAINADEIVERAARAICTNANSDPDAKNAAGQPFWMVFERPARAAVQETLKVLQEAGWLPPRKSQQQ